MMVELRKGLYQCNIFLVVSGIEHAEIPLAICISKDAISLGSCLQGLEDE
jgi:hypothetical protein